MSVFTVTDEDRQTIETIIKYARDALHAAGYEVRVPRFPFVMHHEFYRIKLRKNNYRPKHADISRLLDEWARSQPDYAEAYAWQAIEGAMASLGARKGKEMPTEVENGCARACGSPMAFESWAKKVQLDNKAIN